MTCHSFELNGERVLSLVPIDSGVMLEDDEGQGIAVPTALLSDLIAALRENLPAQACAGCGETIVPDYGPAITQRGPMHWACYRKAYPHGPFGTGLATEGQQP